MKKKLLFIVHLPPPVHGSSLVGSQIFDSYDINSLFDCKYIDLGTSASLNKIGKFNIYKFFKYSYIIYELLMDLVIRKPDLVYFGITVRGIAFYKDAFLVLLCKFFNRKLVFHFNNKGIKSLKFNSIKFWFYKKVFNNSSAIILSDILFADIQDFYSEKQVYVCPYGVHDSAGNAIIDYRKSLLGDLNRNTILYLGNLIRSKGCLTLIEACNELNLRDINFKCYLVGGEADILGSELNREIKRFNLENKVFYLGLKLGSDKHNVFEQADIFVFPTFYSFEAFPIVNIEAMQWGLPVISTFEGGVPNQVIDGKTGFLVEQCNSIALADKIEILLLDRDLRLNLSLASRNRFEEFYTLKNFELRLLSILSLEVNKVNN